MTRGDGDRLKAIVADALDRSPEAREAFLDARLRDAPELRARAEELLAGAEALGPFLEAPCPLAGDAFATSEESEELAADEAVGRYRVVRRLASGGAGTVYEARQERPRRTVALKILHAARGGSLARRFERESELLAQLQHPGIAHVYEAGVHGEGLSRVPFIAMELVPEAQTVVAYADSHRLGLRERLELLIQICRAVQHGHDRGVVHRDLKPANLLVGKDGHPKVIDFGVARVLADDPDDTLQTGAGDLMGTLPYMSPEQCGSDPEAVDARSDVYALGVVLFELLSGRLPLAVVGLPLEDAIRTIRLSPPARLAQLTPTLDRDLDAITFKALEKDPARRYAAAADLAADLQRYLDRRPVVARPPGALHQARLFARRHRYLVIAAAAVVAALATATGVSTGFALRAERAADSEAYQRRVAELTTHYLQEMLRAPSPHRSGADVTVLELLDAMVDRLDSEPVELPEVEVEVRTALGETYLALGRTDQALAQLTRAETICRDVDPRGQPMVSVLVQLGLAHGQAQELAAAEAHYREALELKKGLPEVDPHELAILLGNIGEILLRQRKLPEALEAGEQTREALRRAGVTSGLQLASATRQLARVHELLERHEEGERLLREALETANAPEEHPFVASTLREIAIARSRVGDRAGAREPLARAWSLTSAHRPAGSFDWNITFIAYLDFLREGDERDAVLAHLRSGVTALEAELGENDYRTRESRGLLAHYERMYSDSD